MLVLSRRTGESIRIGRDVEVVVLGTEGPYVRIGVRAPREVAVVRRELLDEVEAENRRAVAKPDAAALARLTPGLRPQPAVAAAAKRRP
jgi:carbon storage regulator